MFIVQSYSLAIGLCFITMLCWGSWANTQKMVDGKWRFELFYWDYVIGILLFSLIAGLTLGSIGRYGRSFLPDLMQASGTNIMYALAGGCIFNLANILLTAAIAIAGMSVAFPIGIGIALVLGVLINYANVQQGDAVWLFSGVVLIGVAILLNAAASRSRSAALRPGAKGILLSLAAGVLMSFFYRFIASAMDLNDLLHPAPMKMTPYTAMFVFSAGILISNFFFNTFLMRRPLSGVPLSYKQYFKGTFGTHAIGILGGCIWALGNLCNLLAAGKAGPAISYGLGQGATLIAALWGVFIWKEFRGATAKTIRMIILMFAFFIGGIGLIVYAGL